MSRTDYLTFGIVAVCVAALAFLIYKMATSSSSDAPVEDYTEQVAPNTFQEDETDTPADTPGGTFGDEQPAQDYTTTTNEMDDKSVTAVDEFPAATQTAPATRTAPAETPRSYASSDGDYMVLAGSFREAANADAMAEKIRKLGYANASVEKFDRGAFAVVLVDRFDTYSQANALVKELGGKGVEATVHRKR